jgi:subtilisin family serine protease
MTKSMVLEDAYVEAFIKTYDIDAAKADVEALGGKVRMSIGNILTVSIPQSALNEIASRDEVVYIEAGKPITPKNDLAMIDINGNEVHSGALLSTPYTGRDTIIGIIDTGIDYSHADFRNTAGKNRILYIWDQTDESGTGPAELNETYGTECRTNAIVNGYCNVRDITGHGTHVAGTAAGRNTQYNGVSPDSYIVAVRYKSELEISDGYANPIFSTTICEAAYYVFKKAEKLGLPAVVNLSLGTHIGPHDGTSLFEECLDSLVENSSGRAIVAAAGNENIKDANYTGLHAGYDVNSLMATNFHMKNYSGGRVIYIDIWQTPSSTLNFGLALNEGTVGGTMNLLGQSGLISPGLSRSGNFLGGKIAYQINTTETESPLNGKPHAGISITFRDDVKDPSVYSFDLLVSGKGHFDAWLYPDKPPDAVNFTSLTERRGVPWQYVPGDSRMSVAIPATARNVIAVAAYATRNSWECCQVSYEIGDILDFSSHGPSADRYATGQKPEIAAPGAMIASAKSYDYAGDRNFITSDGKHVLMAGSSMAAPFVSGTIALLFSVNPDYTYQDVERFITESAYADEYVGSVPNDIWGYGKLDVLGAVEVSLGREPSGGLDENPALNAPEIEDDQKTSSSCQLAQPAGPGGGGTVFLFAAMLILIICVRYRNKVKIHTVRGAGASV